MKSLLTKAKDYKILVVNDDINSLQTIVEHVENTDNNYKVLQSTSGKLALEIATNEQPDLIITDWDMSEMDGIELIRALKKQIATKDIPVIMATAVMTTSKNLKTALDAGAVDYIRIPVDKIELTARVYSMLELSNSYKQIKELNGMKDKFFTIIAHDLRTPFSTLLTYTRILADKFTKFEKEKIDSYIGLISKSAEKAYTLLEDLLLWSRSQRGVMKFQPQKVNLKFIIDDNIELFTSSSQAKKIMVFSEVDKNINLFADNSMINTIVRNLLSNAIKFSPEGETVSFRTGISYLSKSDNSKKLIEITVSDNGAGITKENINKLFRIDISYSTLGTAEEKGTGLGLILCKEFAEKHGGEIRVESEAHKGSNFIFSLPVFEEN